MPNWSVAFFATVPFGRISIPILPDSSENEVTNIINHSESKVIFVSQRLASKVSQEVWDRMTLVIDLDTFEVLKSDDEKFTCDGWKAKILSITNKNVNKSSQVSSVEVMKEPFEKTATQKIRRFKYKESAPTVEEEKRNKR